MKFKVGQKVKIIGHKSWEPYIWLDFLKLVGKLGVITSISSSSSIDVKVGGRIRRFMPRSLELVSNPREQLLFSFMYKKV